MLFLALAFLNVTAWARDVNPPSLEQLKNAAPSDAVIAPAVSVPGAKEPSVIDITEENYDKEVTNSDVPVFLDYFAVWCGPCKLIAPKIEELAEKYKGRVKFGRIDVDQQPGLVDQSHIANMPTFVLVRGGREAYRLIGLDPAKDLTQNAKRLDDAIQLYLIVKILVFDVVGTVVDWRDSLIAEGERLGQAKGITADWPAFADAWAAAYAQSIQAVREGKQPWATVDDINSKSLDAVLARVHIEGLSDQDKEALAVAWHRLKPWPDSVDGLSRLSKGFEIAPLSNCNLALLDDLARADGLPWTEVWSVDQLKHYKPDPEVYTAAAAHFHVKPEEMLMVAAHQYDLEAAKKLGMRTAYVPRATDKEPAPQPGEFDLTADDLGGLASLLGL